ncbi:hypothetical protein RM445_08510 [Pseudonocardia sp. DSM 45834]|jgi:hypothetical protein|uniref:Uncharacterized protein n=2 Tax=Pseudonocardia charpentierae TaxID=3075545 RepID=A0ABU2N758_9PSEU|nr:hypothetical protein [Pseudonocardia sp. DSM 45834]
MSWNMPVHVGHGLGEREIRLEGVRTREAAQNARTARTVAQHSTDAQDCRELLEMLGLRLDDLRTDEPPLH